MFTVEETNFMSYFDISSREALITMKTRHSPTWITRWRKYCSLVQRLEMTNEEFDALYIAPDFLLLKEDIAHNGNLSFVTNLGKINKVLTRIIGESSRTQKRQKSLICQLVANASVSPGFHYHYECGLRMSSY